MRNVFLGSLGLALMMIGGCADRTQEALDAAYNAEESAQSAMVQIEELRDRVDDLETKLRY